MYNSTLGSKHLQDFYTPLTAQLSPATHDKIRQLRGLSNPFVVSLRDCHSVVGYG